MKTIIIAGITRSGLTATMQMLDAGGYPCAGKYPSYEAFDIGEIPFKDLQGKAIKVIDTHTQFPPTGEYHVIRLRRNYKQQAKSMYKLLSNFMPLPKSFIPQSEKSLPKDYATIDAWAKRQKGLLELDFEEIITNPLAAAKKIAVFIEYPLFIDRMAAVIKERSTDCYPTMLETTIINDFLKIKG
jgi:hypothetical protein